ncbi:MAG: hypothetical protein HYU64_12405 [Armatimonadetes bacterium]|nr:hypothetical protein [Armatimonadota bacterium]
MLNLKTSTENLNTSDLAALFGTVAARLAGSTGRLVETADWRFRIIEGGERDQLILSVLNRIHSPELRSAGSDRENDWEDGWRENLVDFVQSDYDVGKLMPKYYKANVPIRLNKQYVLPLEPDFLYRYTQVFRSWIFHEYLGGYDAIYEFGCGTAHNLVHLAAIYPEKELYGFDWVRSSQEIIQILADRLKLKIRGRPFNFFDPDDSLHFHPKSAVFTFGALEQVGADHGKYLDFILRKRPSLCIDIVGIHELYDETHLLDYLALLYHRKRNYLQGYLSRLRELEAAGKIEIVGVHRQLFGNLFDDPYSYVIWKPGESEGEKQ